jgi:hypothetical protein
MTKDLVLAYFMQDLNKLFENLSEIPTLLLEFLTHLLNERSHGVQFEEDTLSLYISLLCQLEPFKVKQELQSF